MPQLFHRSANVLSKASLIAVVLLAAGLFGPLFALARSSWVTGVGLTPQQPLQFSHERHVAGNGLEAMQAAVGPVGATCGACHDAYRQPQ